MFKHKTKEDIERLKISGIILSRTLSKIVSYTEAGIKLSEIDEYARELLTRENARPVFLGYRPEGARKAYHAAICTSVNETIVHGFPGKYILKDGDIVSIDIGVEYEGYITDAATTIGIGKISKQAANLIAVTKESLEAAIRECVPGKRLGDIGNTIESYVKKSGFSVVEGLTGHGVGFELHEDPAVYNYGKKGTGMQIVEGLVIAIEPMVSAGSPEIAQMPDESYVTRDGSLSAHFEHTVAITENGVEVLTREWGR